MPALLLVPAGFGVAAHLATPPEPPPVTRQLFPLDLGTTWVYAVADHGQSSGSHTRQVLGPARLLSAEQSVLNGTQVQDSWTDYPGIGARRIHGYFVPRDTTIDQYGVTSPTHRLQELDPLAQVNALLDDVGDSWTYTGTLDFQELSFTTELAERGSVEVGGRTFEGCSRFVTTIPVEQEGAPASVETQEEWTCPGYGSVRSSDRWEAGGVDVTEELVEFHGASGNWWADPPSAPSPDAEGTALGFDVARTNAVDDGQVGRDLAWTIGRTGATSFPPVSSGNVMVTGDRSGLVAATDVVTGEQVWQVQLAPPILVTPAIAGDEVLVNDGSKELRALSLADGSTRWVHELDDVIAVSPAVSGDAAAVVSESGRLSVLDLTDGSVRWDAMLAGRAAATPAVKDGTVYVSDTSGAIGAYDLDDGDRAWDRELTDGALLGLAVRDDRVLAQDDNGIVYAFNAGTGELEWQARTRGQGLGFLAVTDDTVVTLLANDRVMAVDIEDGSVRWRHSVPKTVVAPVVVGDEVLTSSVDGEVEILDLATGEAVETWRLPRPVAGQRPLVDVPSAVVGDSVVITSDPGSAPAHQTLYAYPLHGTGTGVLLGLEPHIVSGSPTEPVTAVGGDLYVAGYGGTLTRNEPDGRSTLLVTNSERIATGAAVADGLVVARKDDQLQAIPVDGGDPAWSIPAGDSYGGSIPLVRDGTVYAGTSDGRLIAVALADGRLRWSGPVSADYLPSTPLVLPGGDIVYGVGLARYEKDTGTLRWSHQDVFSYGAPVTAGGVVFAAVDGQGGSGFGAWDAATGTSLWFVPGSPAAYVGPSAADGVVVFADAFGTVHALDAGDGNELWSVALDRPVGGVPVVRDGRVFLVSLGRPEVLEQRDYRVAAYDLGSGRFLGSWEPPLTSYWIVPFASPGEEDAVLVPTGLDFEVVVMGVGPVG